MYRCLWVDIIKSQAEIIFVNNICRDFAIDNFIENCRFVIHNKLSFLIPGELEFTGERK